MAMHIYRVTVRGRFGDLATSTREALLATVDDHDFIHARFTPDGTVAYDAALGHFTFRYELRVLDDDGDDADDLACQRARSLAPSCPTGLSSTRVTPSWSRRQRARVVLPRRDVDSALAGQPRHGRRQAEPQG